VKENLKPTQIVNGSGDYYLKDILHLEILFRDVASLSKKDVMRALGLIKQVKHNLNFLLQQFNVYGKEQAHIKGLDEKDTGIIKLGCRGLSQYGAFSSDV
jgi:hypothetical protein